MTSAVLIVPAADRDMANAFGESMGWGPNNYSVPLTTDGTTISHYGCRADVRQGFIDMLADPPPEAAPVIAVLISDFREGDGYSHFHEVIAGLNLAIYEEPNGV
jgi:hypothetical protein